MVEANIVAPGSMAGVISGHMYNRAMRAHKLLFEALSRLQLTLFLDSLDEPTKESYHYTIQKVLLDFNDNKVLAVDQLSELQLHFDRYVEQQCEASPTYRFWKSYQDMVLILLAFTRATRTSNWKRHLASLRQMLPWMFAYDRTNYARYFSAIVFSFVYNQNFQLILTVQLIKDVCIYFICIEILAKQLFTMRYFRYAPAYWMEMQQLSSSHSWLYNQLVDNAGSWTTQHQGVSRLSSMAADQTIERLSTAVARHLGESAVLR